MSSFLSFAMEGEMNMTYKRKKLEELNLLDNFLLGSMMTHPEYGEKVCKQLLQVILQRNFEKLTVFPQKVYFGSDTDLHGAILDVYLEETEDDEVTVYDMEAERDNDEKAVLALPKRVRFYHAKMDSRSLKAGEDYSALKKVIIIMIMPFDPFGLNRMMYTIKNCCIEEPAMPYEDGATTIFLYTKGKVGIPSEALQELMAYMEDSTINNVKNEMLHELHNMVEHVKHEEEVSVKYMRMMESESYLRNMGREEGLEEGLEEGRRIGFIETCKELGLSEEETVNRFMKKFLLSISEAMEYVKKQWESH